MWTWARIGATAVLLVEAVDCTDAIKRCLHYDILLAACILVNEIQTRVSLCISIR